MKKIITVEVICFLLVFLFTYTGLSKLSNHAVFHAQLLNFPFLKYTEPILSWTLPLTELSTVILLIFPNLRLYGLYASFALLLLFTVYLISMIVFKTNLPCSCGGIVQYLSWGQHVCFNCLIIILTALAIYFLRKNNNHSISNHTISTQVST